MNAKQTLELIFKDKFVKDTNDNAYPLDSNLDIEEGEFLIRIIDKYKPKRTIEIGCAQGISSLYICSAVENIPSAFHTIIDPFQNSQWKGVGISNLQRAGVTNFELIEDVSETALPALLASGKKFDFGLIDGWHTFDHTLIDFFYLNRMIEVGGIIVIDDVMMPGINRAVRYILNYDAYELIDNVEIKVTMKRKIVDVILKGFFYIVSKLLPINLRNEIFSSSVLQNNTKLKLRSSMVALKKIKEDNRPWNWFKEF
jgi:predicted O-methyltransferase YrrM